MEKTFAGAINDQVEGKLKEVEDKNKRKAQLQLEIEQLTKETEHLQQEAIENQNTLNSNKNSFYQAGEISKTHGDQYRRMEKRTPLATGIVFEII